jgi:hypothetical protein
MGRKRRQGNMIPQKSNKNIIEDLVGNKGDESPVADVRRMMIQMFNELKEDKQKQLMNPKRTWIMNLRRHRNN